MASNNNSTRPHFNVSHGMSKTTEYNSWVAMKSRCNNPNNSRYTSHGGRGIKVCKRWNDFPQFIYDMGDKPTPSHSIERQDNEGDYTPCNCYWATPTIQSRNQRVQSRSCTGIKGVHKQASGNYWVSIMADYKSNYLGTYPERWDAICARKSAEYKYW